MRSTFAEQMLCNEKFQRARGNVFEVRDNPGNDDQHFRSINDGIWKRIFTFFKSIAAGSRSSKINRDTDSLKIIRKLIEHEDKYNKQVGRIFKNM